MKAWTDMTAGEKAEAVRPLAAKGLSTSQIGLEVGAGRGSVQCVAARAGIPLLHRPGFMRQRPVARQPVIAEGLHAAGEGLAFLETRFGQCRAPLWDGDVPLEAKRCCGAHAQPGSSYCAEHRERFTAARVAVPRKVLAIAGELRRAGR